MSEKNLNPFGKTSAGTVAPEKSSIGKYRRLVAMLMDLAVLHKLAVKRPMENMAAIVRNHVMMYIKIFPFIVYPKNKTAATVTIKVEIAAITPLAITSDARSLKGEHGLQ